MNFSIFVFTKFTLPDGVIGNTPDSGSGKSRFDP